MVFSKLKRRQTDKPITITLSLNSFAKVATWPVEMIITLAHELFMPFTIYRSTNNKHMHTMMKGGGV